MLLDEDLCYQAARSRDVRFDGRFFSAVLTTGIYCRPICPARQPLRKNVRYFACAAAAEEAGFRPCRRCRPDSAPGTPAWVGAPATVARALRLIERGALDEHGVEALAAQVGVGARYLRRLFAKHLGASPQAIAASRRAHFARTLLDATTLSASQVALASGFRSVRQFNQVIRAVFHRTPTELRRAHSRTEGSGGGPLLLLAFRPPFAWEALLAFLAARAIPGVEEVDRDSYRRSFAGSTGAGIIAVRLANGGRSLELGVRGAAPAELLDVVRRVRRLFDIDADPLAIASCLGSSRLLASSVSSRPGLRVPGAWDAFETLVRAMLGQQISVAAATTLSGRLVQRFGTAFAHGSGVTHLFPRPEVLANADLTIIGLPGARAQSVRQVAAAIAHHPQLLSVPQSLEQLIERLCGLPGIGPWTAHYVAMRAFNEPDAFPADDLGLRRATGNISGPRLEALSQSWRPWRAYAAMHLWTRYSEEASHVDRAVAS